MRPRRASRSSACSRSSTYSVGTNGKSSVMCAGTPCWADQSCFARHSCTSGSASGTSTISALRGTGRRVRSGCERRRGADHVAPEGVVAANARDLPEPTLRVRRASGRLGRSGRGPAGARARTDPPRRDRGRALDLDRRTSPRRPGVRELGPRGPLVGVSRRRVLRHLRLLARRPDGARAGQRPRRRDVVPSGAPCRGFCRGPTRPLAPSRLAGPARDLRRRPLPDRRLRFGGRRLALRGLDRRRATPGRSASSLSGCWSSGSARAPRPTSRRCARPRGRCPRAPRPHTPRARRGSPARGSRSA